MKEQFEEGVKAIQHREEKKKTPAIQKEKIDKKKLVIYSELMKPKFDEGII